MAGPQRRSAAWQASKIDGTHLFDLRISNRALRIDRFFWHMVRTPWRDRCLPDAQVLMQESELTEYEKALIRTRDWLGLVRYGAKFFVIEKFARVVWATNLQVYAIMRGEFFEDFAQIRCVPDTRRLIASTICLIAVLPDFPT
ncbi:protocatechuate 3,4-dioxygenase [Xanthomonas fragariae]|uniref:protocatechuate 3,4-dioxygenase n=1 Tax=Xanthomonas fragariae TaxID=48664 RepID=UPI001ABEE63A|nr:protocatechuate 3,4-dioxygenase [Xanthomonas fragariae]UKR52125.1 protocatechuate 3,4-dioxygenase [Xanthomonas fragariae]